MKKFFAVLRIIGLILLLMIKLPFLALAAQLKYMRFRRGFVREFSRCGADRAAARALAGTLSPGKVMDIKISK